MADQRIENTPSSGYVTLPDGRTVPTLDTWFNQQANNPQGFGAAEQRTQLSQGYSQRIAEPLTNALGEFLATPTTIAEMLGFVSPETGTQGRNVGRTVASVVVPQDLTQAGIDVGVIASGGALAPLKLGRGMTAAGRVLGGTAGGALGGYLDTGTPRGAVTGAGRGLFQSGAAETAGAVWDYARRTGPERVKAQMHDLHAAETVDALKTDPRLKGVFSETLPTQAGLEDLVMGTVIDPTTKRAVPKGQYLLSQQMEQADQVIGAAIQRAEQQGVQVRFPAPFKGVEEWVPYHEARQELTQLGTATRKMNPNKEYIIGEVKMSGAQAKQLYADSTRVFQQQLTRVGPDALTAFNDSRGTYAAGLYYLDMLETGFKRKGAVITFNSEDVQKALSKSRRSRAEGINKLGEQEYWKFSQAVGTPPFNPGTVDVYKPGGFLYNTTHSIPGLGGISQYVARPGLADPAALTLSQAQRTGINLMGSQMSAPLAQYLADQMQGLPGLK